MKKIAVMLCLATLIGSNAHATKARVASLLGAKHLVDSQSIFAFPADINALGEYITLEMGPTGAGTTEPKAEGGLFRKHDDAMMGFYLGHHDLMQASFRTQLGYANQTNPVQFFYGKGDWAFTAGLSNTDTKSTKTKETTLYAGFGQTLPNVSWGVNAEVLANAEQPNANAVDTDKYTGSPLLGAQFRTLEDRYWHGSLAWGEVKSKDGATSVESKVKTMGLEVGYIDRTLKTDARDIYYGVSLQYSDDEAGGNHRKVTALPVVLGFEQGLTSWATFRGSLRQNVLLGSVKDEITTPGAEADTIPNNTTVSAGLGLKYGTLTLDGVLTAATSGNINGNQVLAQAGLIYGF